MSELDGGAAFPVVHPDGKGVQYYGMSLRDYFAAKAMQAMVAAEFASAFGPEDWARHAYKVADSMIQERAK